MISRVKSGGKIQRQAQKRIIRQKSVEASPKINRESAPALKTRLRNFSRACEDIWPHVNGGIKTKDDLERLIRRSEIVLLPKSADDNAAVAALMVNKGVEGPKEYINKYGRGNFNFMISEWKRRLDVVFDEIRKNA